VIIRITGKVYEKDFKDKSEAEFLEYKRRYKEKLGALSKQSIKDLKEHVLFEFASLVGPIK
jgi:hypothetical protein